MTEKEKENQIKKKKRGNSLIEALVALGILLVGIVPVVTVATQAILFHHRASEAEEAARISQTMIDYIKSRGYNQLESVTTTNPYIFTPTGSAFTINQFAIDFHIDPDMVLFNSKGINLNDVSFYIDIKTTKGDLKKQDRIANDVYKEYPITGEINRNDVYRKDLIYGKVIFEYGKNEMETTFIMTPIENWK